MAMQTDLRGKKGFLGLRKGGGASFGKMRRKLRKKKGGRVKR